MLNRRQLLMGAAGSPMVLAVGSAFAQRRKAPSIAVVKIISFACPLSRASEALDRPLHDYLDSISGKFVLSPFPVEDETTTAAKDVIAKAARERVYFASRKYGTSVASQVKSSLFKGTQDLGLPLASYVDTYTWLSNDVPGLERHFADMFLKAQEAEAGESVGKVAYLAHHAGSRSLPSYIVIVDGKIQPALGPDDVGGSLPKLRDAVIQSIKNHLKKA